MRAVLVLVALLWSSPALPQAAALRIIDGDTLVLAGTTYRLFGIDAPEKAQRCLKDGIAWQCGIAATEALTKLVSGRDATCRGVELDRYGRTVAVCSVDGIDLGKAMVRDGWALAYRTFSRDYVDDENLARAGKLGIWTSGFVTPEEWRRGLR